MDGENSFEKPFDIEKDPIGIRARDPQEFWGDAPLKCLEGDSVNIYFVDILYFGTVEDRHNGEDSEIQSCMPDEWPGKSGGVSSTPKPNWLKKPKLGGGYITG